MFPLFRSRDYNFDQETIHEASSSRTLAEIRSSDIIFSNASAIQVLILCAAGFEILIGNVPTKRWDSTI
jgi:hypothetical protein